VNEKAGCAKPLRMWRGITTQRDALFFLKRFRSKMSHFAPQVLLLFLADFLDFFARFLDIFSHAGNGVTGSQLRRRQHQAQSQ
jgi:hypothetical protein